jgi:undecaprenyl-diphosphatase
MSELDRSLFLFLNSINSPFFDEVMFYISRKYTWIPLYLTVVLLIIIEKGKRAPVFLLFIIALIAITDQTSVRLFKDVFLRLRPCHDPDIAHLVHIVRDRCGGLYGFVSSHAANSFAFATFTYLTIRKRWYTILIFSWAAVVSYSRIYLGVHYPADIIGGAALGVITGAALWYLCGYTIRSFPRSEKKG